MNYKLYALLLTLTLATTPALQAMRATRSLLATSRSLRPAIGTGKHALARTYSTNNNGHGYGQEEPRHGYGNYSIPTTAAIAIGLGLNAQNALEQKEDYTSIDKLDITDIKAVLEILKSGTEDDKRIVASKVAQRITKYTIEDIVQMLLCTEKRPHRTLINAITKKITYFTTEQISKILMADKQDDTHDLIASSLKKNYRYFTSTIAGLKIFSSVNNMHQYAAAISSLKEKYFLDALEPLAAELATYRIYDLNEFLKKTTKQSQVATVAALVQNISKDPSGLYYAKYYSDKSVQVVTSAVLCILNNSNDAQIVDTQSTAHLKNNVLATIRFLEEIIRNQKYKKAFKLAINHEHAVTDTSAVFYHSQRSPVYWLELLYTKLWEKKYNQKLNNYLFTRFTDDQTEFSNAVLQLDGHQKRIDLINNGRKEGQDELRPYLLFVNYALFGNSTNWGSCSAFYFVNNFNVGDPSITTQTIVNKFGDTALYDQYKTEFEQLETEFKAIVTGSILLQLCIPFEVLNDHVYLAEPGGFKKKLTIGDKATDNVETIIKTLKAVPKTLDDSDEQEFCVVVTPDTVHTLHEQGAQVRVYGGFDQEKLNAFIKKLEALVARIAQENPQTFSGKMTPTQSYQAYKPVLDDLLQKKD